MEESFIQLLQTALPHINVIFWDLDGTLGEQPGWNGTGSVFRYVKNPQEVSRLLHRLQNEYGIRSVLVSRNSMFCGENYDTVQKDFQALGFTEIFSCYRTRQHSKVYGFANDFSVLLVDDQLQECREACEDGACALHIHDIFQRALPSGKFAIWYP